MASSAAASILALHRRAGWRTIAVLALLALAILAWRWDRLHDDTLDTLGRLAESQRAGLETVLGSPEQAESRLLAGTASPDAVRELARAMLWQWRWPEGRVFLETEDGRRLTAPAEEHGDLSPPEGTLPLGRTVTEQGYAFVQAVGGTGLRLIHLVDEGTVRARSLAGMTSDFLLAVLLLVATGAAWLYQRRSFVVPGVRVAEGLAAGNGLVAVQEPRLPDPWRELWARGRRQAMLAADRQLAFELEEARLIAVVQTASDGVMIVDEHGHPTVVNDAFLRLLPADVAGPTGRGESLRRPTTTDARPGSAEAVFATMADRLTRPAAVSGSFALPTLPEPITVEELPTTDRHRIWIARPVLAARSAADEAGHAESRHLAAVALMGRLARELADPLALLVSQTRRLCDEAPDEPTRFRAERALASAEHCAELVDTCRAIAGDRTPRFGMVLADELVEQVLAREAATLAAAAIEVVRGFSPHPPPLWADAEQLDTVFTRLLANARDALLTRAAPRRITLRLRRFEERLLLDVEDNGPGIAPAVESRLLEPFVTTKGDRGGTGLGLAYCRGIVGMHGGFLRIGGNKAGGTCVTLGMPYRSGAPEPTSVTRLVLTPPAPGRARIAASAGATAAARPAIRAVTAEVAGS